MPATSWYYRPTTSPNYPSIPTRWDNSPRTPFSQQSLPSPQSQEMDDVIRSMSTRPVNKDFLERMCRPTMSSRYKTDCPRLSFGNSQRYLSHDDHYVWSKMDFLADCYRCMYSRYGSVRKSTKR